MTEHELLIETTPFMTPGAIVDAIDESDAERRVPGAPHSIAEVVAHMIFWQEWFAARAQGHGGPMAARAAHGWPAVSPGSWPDLRARFVSGLDALNTLAAEGSRLVEPPIEYPPLATYTVRDVLEHVALHNAHHLGQVVLLRQQLGQWPPPSGSYTW
jgi:uncharacterized damage-inducible protein DinB